MPRTIQCTQCGVVLNLPPQAAGKRLKCPKCGAKFLVDQDTSKYPSTELSGHDASPSSSMELPRGQVPVPSGQSDAMLPTSPGDLRDTFDLPLLSEPASSGAGSAQPAKAQAADALALFEEKKPASRRPNAAEARAQARRCPTCGGVVGVGMSICATCGLDLETGARVAFDDEIMPEAPTRAPGPPLPVTIIALISLLGSAILTIYSTMLWAGGAEYALYAIPIWIFGGFAAVHLIRGHSAKLLLIAMTLGVIVDVVAFIALPIWRAEINEPKVVAQRPSDDPDLENVAIAPASERLDTQKIALGITILLLYAGIASYLASPGVRRNSGKR